MDDLEGERWVGTTADAVFLSRANQQICFFHRPKKLQRVSEAEGKDHVGLSLEEDEELALQLLSHA